MYKFSRNYFHSEKNMTFEIMKTELIPCIVKHVLPDTFLAKNFSDIVSGHNNET